MKRLLIGVMLAATLISTLTFAKQISRASAVYYPAAGEAWEKKRPEDVGMDSAMIDAAVSFAKTQESKMPRDFSTQVQTFGALLGPIPKTEPKRMDSYFVTATLSPSGATPTTPIPPTASRRVFFRPCWDSRSTEE